MAILEEYVDVASHQTTISHYESLGYVIPRRKDIRGKMRVMLGTDIRVKVSDLPTGSRVKLTKICDTCGNYTRDQPYRAIIRHRDNGVDTCNSCARALYEPQKALRRAVSGHNLAVKYPSVAELWHPRLNGDLTPSEVTPKSRMRVWWLCNEDECGNAWEAVICGVTRGSRCPACSMSKGERRIREYLRFLRYEFTTEEPMHGLVGVNGGDLRYDIAIKYSTGYPALLIEYDGIGHFEPTDFAGNGEADAVSIFERQREHDRRKDEYAFSNGIPLLRIHYRDFDIIERKINEALAQVVRG